MRIARRFNAGENSSEFVPKGRLNHQPSLRDFGRCRKPGVETPGYDRLSLRDAFREYTAYRNGGLRATSTGMSRREGPTVWLSPGFDHVRSGDSCRR